MIIHELVVDIHQGLNNNDHTFAKVHHRKCHCNIGRMNRQVPHALLETDFEGHFGECVFRWYEMDRDHHGCIGYLETRCVIAGEPGLSAFRSFAVWIIIGKGHTKKQLC